MRKPKKHSPCMEYHQVFVSEKGRDDWTPFGKANLDRPDAERILDLISKNHVLLGLKARMVTTRDWDFSVLRGVHE